jgi:hypothetical protein
MHGIHGIKKKLRIKFFRFIRGRVAEKSIHDVSKEHKAYIFKGLLLSFDKFKPRDM